MLACVCCCTAFLVDPSDLAFLVAAVAFVVVVGGITVLDENLAEPIQSGRVDLDDFDVWGLTILDFVGLLLICFLCPAMCLNMSRVELGLRCGFVVAESTWVGG